MKRFFLFVCSWAGVLSAGAQTNFELANFKSQTNVFPPSPNASALAKFVEIPVNAHTGIPQVSVPIYSWKSKKGNATVSVGLGYHAGGIKVEDVASSTGLGWSLNAGGSITRSIRGRADDDNWGYINTPALYEFNTWKYNGGFYLPPELFTTGTPGIFSEAQYFDTSRGNIISQHNTTGPEEAQYIKLHKNEIDPEQDLFIYSCEGISGKFVLNKDADVVKLDDNDLVIYVKIDSTYNPSLQLIKRIAYFTITAPTGIKYVFDQTESSYSITYTDGDASTSDQSVSTYQISKLIDLNSSDTIFFDYTSRAVQYVGGWSQNIQYFLNWVQPTMQTYPYPSNVPMSGGSEGTRILSDMASWSLNTSESKVLSRIRLPDGNYVRFYYDQKRDDLHGDSMLNRIEIADYLGNLKKYRLNYSYFSSDNTVANPTTQTWNLTGASYLTGAGYYYSYDHFNKRLRLDNIKEISRNSSDTLPVYGFVYNDTLLPPRHSKAIDYWGYYYGPTRPAVTLITQLPSELDIIHYATEGLQTGATGFNYSYQTIMMGADRKPDSLYTRASVLKRINLPMGGYTTFDYEVNRVKDPVYGDGWLQLYTTTSPIIPDSAARTITMNNRTAQGVLFKVDFVRVNANGSPYTPPEPGGGPEGCFDNVGENSELKMIVRSSDGVVLKDATFYGVASGAGQVFIYFQLPLNKTYTVTYYRVNGGTACVDSAYFSMETTAKYEVENTNNLVGGLRTKQISHYDPVAGTTLRTVYDYIREDGYSSGIIPAIPNYEFHASASGKMITVAMSTEYVYDLFYSRTSTSTQTLGYTGGSNVGYTRVRTRKLDETGTSLGYTIQNYGEPVVKNQHDKYPYKTIQQVDWVSGLQVSELVYNGAGDLQAKTQYWYDSTLASYTNEKNRSLKISNIRRNSFDEGSAEYNTARYVAHAFYPWHGKSRPAQTRSVQYANGDSLVNHSYNSYLESPQRLSEVSQTNSKGETEVKKYFYPVDFSHTAQVKLVNNSVKIIPVATRSYLVKGSTHYETGGAGSDYQVVGNYAKPYQFFARTGVPSTVTNAHSLASYSSVKQTTDDLEGEVLQYDSYGNPVYIKGKDEVPVTIIWGYNGTLPVAKVIGADYSTTVAKFSTVTYSSIQSVTDPATLRSKTHELRNGFSGNLQVQVITYTYQPLIGVTSETDAENRTTYYEYDGFGRLIYVRDKDNYIVKRICYNYAGVASDCGGSVAEPSCNESNCSGVDKKCISGVCETGQRICVSSTRTGQSTWYVSYYYKWSDNSVSSTYTEYANAPCVVLD